LRLEDYYKTIWWKEFTKNITSNINCECELCHRKKWKIYKNGKKKNLLVFNIHHKHYNTLFKEKRSDVSILCRTCHQLCHELLRRNSEDSEFFKDLKDVVKKYFIYNNGKEDL